MKIVFTGPEDVRILAAADLDRHSAIAGFAKTAFVKGQPKDVDDEVALALLAQSDIYGKFEEFEVGEPVSVTKSEAAKEAEKEASPALKGPGQGAKTASTNTSGSTARS